MLLESLFILIFNVLFVRAGGQGIWSVIYGAAKPSLDKNLKIKQLISILFTLLVTMVEVRVYLALQTPNFYEQYNLTRNFTPAELKSSYRQILYKFHPDKNPEISSEIFHQLKQINDVFQNGSALAFYDRYGSVLPTTNDQHVIIQRAQNQHKVSFMLFYMITTLMALIQTFHRDLRSARGKALLFIAVFAYNEWSQMKEPNYEIYLEKIFKRNTIFQIIMIQRILLSMIIVGLIFYQRCLVRGMEWVNQTLQYCRKNQTSEHILTYLTEVTSQLRKIEEEQKKQNFTSNSTIQKVTNFGVMVTMLGFAGVQLYVERSRQQ